jgi:hypothetical protein
MLGFDRSVDSAISAATSDPRQRNRDMDTSLISAMFAARVGQLQLVVAARLAKTDPQSGASVSQLIDAAQQNFDPLESVAAAPGTNVDISC